MNTVGIVTVLCIDNLCCVLTIYIHGLIVVAVKNTIKYVISSNHIYTTYCLIFKGLEYDYHS